ncbi:hypothetical protein BDR22DRAFT_894432 [Usnea florida]
MSRREGTEALIFDTSLVSRGSFTGHMASSSPLHDTTLAGHLLYIGIHNKSLVDVGEGDFTWAFIVAPENAKPESKYQKYWMSEVPDTTGLTNVLGRKEETLIAFKEDDLLCKILLAEVEDMGKLREVMCLPQSPKTVIEDMKGESMRWVRGMLGIICPKWLGTFAIHFWNWWTIDLRNREESDEWLFRKSESPKLEDHASFVKRMNAYRNDDSSTSESSRIEDEGGKDMKGPDTSPSLLSSKKPRPRAGEVVAKGKRTEATGVMKTAPPECQQSSGT